MPRRIACIVLVFACVHLARAATPANEPLPTEDDLRQLFKAGDYQPLVLKATRILQLKGDAAKKYKRYDILMLKGEAQLRLKQLPGAIESFAAAAKEAKEPKEVNLAAALEILVRKSPGGKYILKGLPGSPPDQYDIADEQGRKRAFEALYSDEASAAGPKIKAAENAQSLPPILDGLKVVSRLRILELIAKGTDEKTTDSAKELGVHAAKLMTAAVDGLRRDVQIISARANSTIRSTNPQSGTTAGYQQRGLWPADTKALREYINTADQITQAAKDLQTATKAEGLANVAAASEKVAAEAQALLDTDFSTQRGGTKR
jgi:hypothetical protein